MYIRDHSSKHAELYPQAPCYFGLGLRTTAVWPWLSQSHCPCQCEYRFVDIFYTSRNYYEHTDSDYTIADNCVQIPNVNTHFLMRLYIHKSDYTRMSWESVTVHKSQVTFAGFNDVPHTQLHSELQTSVTPDLSSWRSCLENYLQVERHRSANTLSSVTLTMRLSSVPWHHETMTDSHNSTTGAVSSCELPVERIFSWGGIIMRPHHACLGHSML